MARAKKASTAPPGMDFEREVEHLLRLKGYHVERNVRVKGTQIDLVASTNDSLSNVKLVVECGDHKAPVGVDIVKAKASVLFALTGEPFIYRLLYVSRNGFTAEAKTFADENPGVVLRTPSQLERELIDFQPYVDWYVYNYERNEGMFREARLAVNYVELTARTESGDLLPSLTITLREWLTSAKDNILFLLGEFGAGKTSFCRQLIYVMLRERARGTPGTEPIPILINLREYRTGVPSMKQIVTDALLNHYGVRLPSFTAFEQFASGGRVALILDGFDEMADRADFQTLVDCFQQIYILAALNVKIVVTCRSNVFQSHADLIALLKRFSISIRFEDGTLDVPFERHGRILTLERLSDAQIHEFVVHRFGRQADAMVRKIKSIHDLSDLSTRPVLLDMILTTLPQLAEAGDRINSAALYEKYTNNWTARDDWRVTLPLEVRTEFCDVLALMMHLTRLEELGYERLEETLVRSLHDLADSEAQLDRFKNDIQTCSFLVRSGGASTFRFAHKSFLEFFVARRIVGLLLTKKNIAKESEAPQGHRERRILSSLLDSIGSSVDSVVPDYVRVPIPIRVAYTFPTFFGGSRYASVWESLNDRLRGDETYVRIVGAKTARLPRFRSDETLRQHLHQRMEGVFHDHIVAEGGEKRIPMTEEIATFAVEILENRKLAMKSVVEAAESADAIVLLAEVIRLTKATEFLQTNAAYFEEYIASTDGKPLLKVAFAGALAKVPELITFDLLMKIRSSVPADGWRYALFEYAEQPNRDTELLRRCVEMGTALPLFDRLICIHGLRGVMPEKMRELATEELFEELMHSGSEEYQLLALQLCYDLTDSDDSPIRLIARIWDKALTPRVQEEAVRLLSMLQGKSAWMRIRTMWQRESDDRLRIRLKEAEKIVRDNTSAKRSRVTWDQARSRRAVRDAMWSGLS